MRKRQWHVREFCMTMILLMLEVEVEASHANAHARAIAFFSYIWFKYDILSLHCCQLHSVVVIMLSYQPPTWVRFAVGL